MFRARNIVKRYTKIPSVHGEGYSSPKQGDHIWPEENMILIVYCEEDEAAAIRQVVRELRQSFPDEGLALFETPARQPDVPES
jgi:hypothetical protein